MINYWTLAISRAKRQKSPSRDLLELYENELIKLGLSLSKDALVFAQKVEPAFTVYNTKGMK